MRRQRVRGYGEINKGLTSGLYDKVESNFTPLKIWLGMCQTGTQRLQPTTVKKWKKKLRRQPIKSSQTDGSRVIGNYFNQYKSCMGSLILDVYQL